MIFYTKDEINTIIYSIDDTDELRALIDYLEENGRLYPSMLHHWVEDIRLLTDLLK